MGHATHRRCSTNDQTRMEQRRINRESGRKEGEPARTRRLERLSRGRTAHHAIGRTGWEGERRARRSDVAPAAGPHRPEGRPVPGAGDRRCRGGADLAGFEAVAKVAAKLRDGIRKRAVAYGPRSPARRHPRRHAPSSRSPCRDGPEHIQAKVDGRLPGRSAGRFPRRLGRRFTGRRPTAVRRMDNGAGETVRSRGPDHADYFTERPLWDLVKLRSPTQPPSRRRTAPSAGWRSADPISRRKALAGTRVQRPTRDHSTGPRPQ